MVNLPNLISLLRLGLAPLSIWLIVEGLMLEAFWVFVLAGVSDAVDGFLAKTFDMETELGKYLDPIADKALLVSVYVTLGVEGHIESWLVILVVARDVAIVGGAWLLETLTHALEMKPSMISKINTTAQIVHAALVLGGLGFAVDVSGLVAVFVLIVAVTTVLSWIGYALVLARLGGQKGET